MPPKLDPISGSALVTMPGEISPSMEVRVSCGLDVGGALVKLNHYGVEIGAPSAAPGMELLSHDSEGVLTVLVYSLAGHRIPAGNSLLFILPVNGDGEISFAEVSAADSHGRLIDIFTRLEAPLPNETELAQNYPNPFNSTTRISLALTESGDVELSVYDIAGRRIRTLVNGRLDVGYHSIVWNGLSDKGEAVSSGIYFARMKQINFEKTIKMSLLK
jgi:hypothetical protein